MAGQQPHLQNNVTPSMKHFIFYKVYNFSKYSQNHDEEKINAVIHKACEVGIGLNKLQKKITILK